jgi:hypothetical protein
MGAWYWYIEKGYHPEPWVKIHMEKPGFVRAEYWVIPARVDVYEDKKYAGTEDWRLYMQPWWRAAGLDYAAGWKDGHPLDCEWVCVKREKAPVYKREAVGVDVCESCGHEETVWEHTKVE